MGTDILIAVLIAIPLAFILAIAVTPIFELMRIIWYVPFVQKKLLAKAIEQGNVVKGKLIYRQQLDREGPGGSRISSRKVYAIYQYEYKGKTYKYRVTITGGVPDELTLYFLKKPRKACHSSDVGLHEPNVLLHYFWIAIVLSVVLTVVMYFVVNGTIPYDPEAIKSFIHNGF